MIVDIKECQIAERKPHSHIMKVPNLRKRGENRVCWARKNPENIEAVTRKCPVTKGVLKSFAKSTAKHLYWGLFLIKLQVSGNKIFKNTFFKNTFGGCFWRWTRQNQTIACNIPTEQLLIVERLNFEWFVLNYFGISSKYTCSNIFL